MKKVLALLPLLGLLGCAGSGPAPLSPPETRTAAQFARWRAETPQRAAEVQAFEAMLMAQGFNGLLPLDQLLRSASDWERCAAQPYAVPPPAQWEQVQSTLRLFQHLRATGVLRELELHSAYRDASLNACAGGAARSAHLVAFAIDFRPLDDADAGARLCRFWQTQGEAWKMGLSRYPSGRVHIDTWRYRSWGADHSGQSAFCLPPSRPETQAS